MLQEEIGIKENSILTITPNNLLDPTTNYTLILHIGSITDLAGNPIANFNSFSQLRENKNFFFIISSK